MRARFLLPLLALLYGVRRYEMSRLRLKARLAQLQAELRVAARIQRCLQPNRPPKIPGYDLAVCNLPQREIGGDYTDFVAIDGDRLAICLGDVSGKGLPAALVIAGFQAVVRSHAVLGALPSECARGANSALFHLFDGTEDGTFATLFYGILEYRRHALMYCNAGHEQPILAGRSSGVVRLDGGGLLLGVVEEPAYETQERELAPGDVVVLFSDGVTDAEDESGQPFGTQRLEEIIRRSAAAPAAEVVDAVVAAVRHHVAGAPLPDDLSLVAIKRLD